MGQYPFYDERFTADGGMKDHPFNQPHYQGASILLANANFGCGSSREHAPQALAAMGHQGDCGGELWRDLRRNCAMLGFPP